LTQRLNLGKYLDAINTVAAKSPMADEIPGKWPDLHSPFAVKYEIVRERSQDLSPLRKRRLANPLLPRPSRTSPR
jgi:hypothetical protein